MVCHYSHSTVITNTDGANADFASSPTFITNDLCYFLTYQSPQTWIFGYLFPYQLTRFKCFTNFILYTISAQCLQTEVPHKLPLTLESNEEFRCKWTSFSINVLGFTDFLTISLTLYSKKEHVVETRSVPVLRWYSGEAHTHQLRITLSLRTYCVGTSLLLLIRMGTHPFPKKLCSLVECTITDMHRNIVILSVTHHHHSPLQMITSNNLPAKQPTVKGSLDDVWSAQLWSQLWGAVYSLWAHPP